MRRILVASLLSSFALTAAAATGKPATDAPAAIDARPVSTGVTNPQLYYSTKIEIPAEDVSAAFPNPATVVLKVNLDETGSPKSVQVVKPLSQNIDQRVVAAVKQFRWRPAVLDNQTIPVSMNLIVSVQR
jgi:periplasmic protein TonB